MQSFTDAAGNQESSRGKSGGNKTNLSNLFKVNKSTRVDYLTLKIAKKGGNNSKSSSRKIKKCVKAAQGSNYLTSIIKKAFNYL